MAGKALCSPRYEHMVMQMMVDCCAMDDTACLTLKEEFPELQSTDPDMNPDFCAMHGNVCIRWAEALMMHPSIPARRSIVPSPYDASHNTCQAQHCPQPICLRGIASIHDWAVTVP